MDKENLGCSGGAEARTATGKKRRTSRTQEELKAVAHPLRQTKITAKAVSGPRKDDELVRLVQLLRTGD
eukprot:CAMPEP_0118929300 /NCGR_PEP_ID=MMETSP1169-20130426/6341_1 /TAXON_ID=36882 /ORGANISM="Pyramimonas obovata, Strain CCMP722" /LENGTH=68 /DNA_ID=CAMNT_0006871463 /DNA_START=57 /DNA_END=260 /DNA_ORIENTATION=-